MCYLYIHVVIILPRTKEVKFLPLSVCVSVCLSVRLLVCPLDYSKHDERILVKLSNKDDEVMSNV